MSEKKIAGFQNMGDMVKAMKFAKNKSYILKEKQQLRSLLTYYNSKVIMMFILSTDLSKDIVVFHEGTIKDSKFADGYSSLTTKPFALIEL